MVISLKRQMEEYQRLIFEELKRIAESYRSEAEVARNNEKALSSSMSGLVGANTATNQTLVQLRELEREIRRLIARFIRISCNATRRRSSQQSFPVNARRE